MKVSHINSYNSCSFKSQNFDDANVFGYDDVSKMRREHIREHIYENAIPYQSIYERERRLEEFELKKLINSLLRTNVV